MSVIWLRLSVIVYMCFLFWRPFLCLPTWSLHVWKHWFHHSAMNANIWRRISSHERSPLFNIHYEMEKIKRYCNSIFYSFIKNILNGAEAILVTTFTAFLPRVPVDAYGDPTDARRHATKPGPDPLIFFPANIFFQNFGQRRDDGAWVCWQ